MHQYIDFFHFVRIPLKFLNLNISKIIISFILYNFVHKYTILIFKCLKIVRIVTINKSNDKISQFFTKIYNHFFSIFSIFYFFNTVVFFGRFTRLQKIIKLSAPISSRVYSENSKLIAEYALEKRLFIPFESIPEKVVNSFLSAEDKNFLAILELMPKVY